LAHCHQKEGEEENGKVEIDDTKGMKCEVLEKSEK
jgi:hypothetical protein